MVHFFFFDVFVLRMQMNVRLCSRLQVLLYILNYLMDGNKDHVYVA